MEPSACRDAIAALLSREASALEELAVFLDHEHALLVANDVDALEAAMEKRQESVGRLLHVEEERRVLCRMHGHTPDPAGLEKLLAWCDPDGTLKPRWADCAKGATRCRELNDKNGALVAARMRRVETMLGALTGEPQAPATYGPRGAYSQARAGRMLTTEA